MISLHLVYAATQAARASAPLRPGAHVVVLAEPVRWPRPAPRSPSPGLAATLTAPLSDGRAPLAPPLPRMEAARGFSEGSFYLPGQIIDRRA